MQFQNLQKADVNNQRVVKLVKCQYRWSVTAGISKRSHSDPLTNVDVKTEKSVSHKVRPLFSGKLLGACDTPRSLLLLTEYSYKD